MTQDTQTGTHGSSVANTDSLQPFLFVVVQGNALDAPAIRIKLVGTQRVTIGRAEKRSCQPKAARNGVDIELRLADDRISTEHCEIRREANGYVLVDAQSKNGTRVDGVQTREVVLADGALIELGRSFLLYRKHLAPANVAAITTLALSNAVPGFSTLVPSLAKQFDDFAAVAQSEVPLLVRGETGTGKELAAVAAHSLSKRSGPFVPVNCGALASTLASSELFGAKKGAFSGATEDRLGLVRAADRGTLFLDEVGDLPLDVQAMLLRVIQEQEVLQVGATKAVKVDVRLVAATHRDLEAMVASGQFRRDLFARLSGFTLRLPSLRTRREDLGLVLAGIAGRRRLGDVAIRNSSVRLLFAAPFERNIRELEQAIAAASSLSAGGELDLTSSLEGEADAPVIEAGKDADLKQRLEASLKAHNGNVSAVAAEFGKARMQIQRWMKRFNLRGQAP